MESEHRAKPERIGNILSKVLSKMQLLGKMEELRSVEEWDEIVGERIAEVTSAITVKNGKLIVEVSSSAWMSELVMMKTKILQRLNEKKRKGKLTDIFFRLGDIK